MAGIVISDRHRIALRGGKGKMPAEIREERFEGEARGDLLIILEKGLKAGGTEKEDFSASGLLDLFDVIPKSLRVGAGTDVPLDSLTTDLVDQGEIDTQPLKEPDRISGRFNLCVRPTQPM